MNKTILDDLDTIAPGPVETVAFYSCMVLLVVLVVAVVSFTTGYAWAYLRAGILAVLG
jgi:hypothetical protein